VQTVLSSQIDIQHLQRVVGKLSFSSVRHDGVEYDYPTCYLHSTAHTATSKSFNFRAKKNQ